MMGYTEQELSSLTFKDITHPEDIETNIEHVKRLYSGEISLYKTEKRYIKKNKEILWASTIVSVVRDDNGKFLYYLAMVEDITQRKLIEKELQKSEEKFRKYINHAPAAIFIVDGQGRHIECNEAAYKLSGYSESEHKNMSIPDMADPKEQQNLIESFENLKKTGYDSSEITLKRKDGKVICISLDAVKLSEDRFMAFCSDITDNQTVAGFGISC